MVEEAEATEVIEVGTDTGAMTVTGAIVMGVAETISVDAETTIVDGVVTEVTTADAEMMIVDAEMMVVDAEMTTADAGMMIVDAGMTAAGLEAVAAVPGLGHMNVAAQSRSADLAALLQGVDAALLLVRLPLLQEGTGAGLRIGALGQTANLMCTRTAQIRGRL